MTTVTEPNQKFDYLGGFLKGRLTIYRQFKRQRQVEYDGPEDCAKRLGETYEAYTQTMEWWRQEISNRRACDFQDIVKAMKKLERSYTGVDDKFVETVRQKRHEAEKILGVLSLRAPRGNQTDLVISFSVWQIANEVLQKYHKPNWSMVANLVAEHFPVKPGWDADNAQKRYEKYWGLITDSAKGNKLLGSLELKMRTIADIAKIMLARYSSAFPSSGPRSGEGEPGVQKNC